MSGKLVTKNNALFDFFSVVVLYLNLEHETKIKALNIVMKEERLFISIDIQISSIICCSRHTINRAGSKTLFNSQDAFLSVSLSAKN